MHGGEAKAEENRHETAVTVDETVILLHALGPEMALVGHSRQQCPCPLSEVERTPRAKARRGPATDRILAPVNSPPESLLLQNFFAVGAG
jgi:hypothetical protein